jgi:hypothetical protein
MKISFVRAGGVALAMAGVASAAPVGPAKRLI